MEGEPTTIADDEQDRRKAVLLTYSRACAVHGVASDGQLERALHDWSVGARPRPSPPDPPTAVDAERRGQVVSDTLLAARHERVTVPLVIVAAMTALHMTDPDR